MHPLGDGYTAVGDLNNEYNDEFVVGDVPVEGFCMATKWQRNIVQEIIDKLQNVHVAEHERVWDGWSFNDLTYRTVDKMYMQTTAFFNFK